MKMRFFLLRINTVTVNRVAPAIAATTAGSGKGNDEAAATEALPWVGCVGVTSGVAGGSVVWGVVDGFGVDSEGESVCVTSGVGFDVGVGVMNGVSFGEVGVWLGVGTLFI